MKNNTKTQTQPLINNKIQIKNFLERKQITVMEIRKNIKIEPDIVPLNETLLNSRKLTTIKY